MRNVQQMDVSDLSFETLTDEDNVFLEHVIIDIQSYINVLNTSPEKRIVLLFPPVNNFRRFLVHQLVEKAFRDNLKTLSVGSLYARRTVVFPGVLKLLEKNLTNTSQNIVPKTVNQFERMTSRDTTLNSIASSSRHRTKKLRKPDLQIYVPRGRRLLETEKCKNDDENMLDTDGSFVDCASDPSDQSTKRISDGASEIPSSEKCQIDNSVSNEMTNHDSLTMVRLNQMTSEIPSKKVKDDDPSMVEDNPELHNTFDSTFGVTSQVKGSEEIVNSVRNENIRESDESITNQVPYTIEIGINNGSALVCGTDAESVEKDAITIKSVHCVTANAVVSHSDDYIEKADVKEMKSDHSRRNVEGNFPEVNLPKNTAIVDVPVSFSDATTSSSVPASSSNLVESSIVNKIARDKITKSAGTKNSSAVDLADCDWEELFDDAGDFVHKSLIEELMTAIGKVSIQRASQNYQPFQTTEERSSDGECIIEIHGFTPDLKTEDLFTIFAPYRVDRGFQIVWVDDTHALAIFSSPILADEVLNTELPFVKTRPLKNAIPKSRMIAQGHVIPQMTRPKTCVSLARRLVSGHLGMKINVTDKQREAERKLLSDAREQKRLEAKQKLDAWEGTGSGEST